MLDSDSCSFLSLEMDKTANVYPVKWRTLYKGRTDLTHLHLQPLSAQFLPAGITNDTFFVLINDFIYAFINSVTYAFQHDR